MARRRQKKRTHVKKTEEELKNIPKSMVIHLGTALENHTLTQLVKDTRNMMQPHTAIKLKERKANKLKDFVVMAGPLGITYLMLFSQNEKTGSTHLRLASMPRGPTISFKIIEYSLCKDITRIQRTPKSISASSSEFINPPLLVMNGFTNPKDASPEEKLVVTMFQNMFPPISPMNTKVGTIRRVLLLNKDKETGLIELRHYIIDTKLVDVSRNVKKLINIKSHLNKKLPNLSKTKDVADIILDPYAQAGFTSDSEVEDESIVEVKDDEYASKLLTKPVADDEGDDDENDIPRQNEGVKRKKAVKLTEIGPRMKLSLVKIEEGVCNGKVLYHAHYTKSDSEMNKLEQRHALRRKERELRKKEQATNVAKKKEAKLLKKQRREERKKAGEEVDSQSEESSEEEEEEDDDDDDDIEMSDYSEVDEKDEDGKDDKLFDEDE